MRPLRKRGSWIFASRPRIGQGERWRAGELLGTAATGRAGAARPKKAKRKGGRSLLSKLVYAGLVLCLWGVIGVGGVVAYYASQLPPIDQLTVPKRPPNIAIMASDGSLLANRGETGGRTVTLKELPPYLPKAFVAIEDRRFYDHFGIDPIGIARAVYRNLAHQRRPAGRLDPDAAARQEPLPDPGAHRLAQDPGGDPGALARAQLLQGPDPRALPQPGLFRRRRLRRRGRRPALLRQVGAQRVALGSRRARGPRAGPLAPCAQPQSRARPGPRRARDRGHERARLHHARHDQDGARRARRARAPQGRRLRQLRRRLRDGRARRFRRQRRDPTSWSRRPSSPPCRRQPSACSSTSSTPRARSST